MVLLSLHSDSMFKNLLTSCWQNTAQDFRWQLDWFLKRTIDSAAVLPVNFWGQSWSGCDCWADCRPDTGYAHAVEERWRTMWPIFKYADETTLPVPQNTDMYLATFSTGMLLRVSD